MVAGECATWVDPRVCGGARPASFCNRSIAGRSPRVRGSLEAQLALDVFYRSIPACAGEPYERLASLPTPWVDPRVCGGANATWHEAI